MCLGNDLVKDDDTKKKLYSRRDFWIVFYEEYLCLGNVLAKDDDTKKTSIDRRDFWIVFYEVPGE